MSDDEKPKVKSDEAWKEKVKAEDAARDASRAETASTEPDSTSAPVESAEASTKGDSAAGSSQPTKSQGASPQDLPPPNFQMLVSMLSTQAMIGLGMFADPETADSGPQLHLAKHFIELLALLEEKTKRNLTGHEDQLLKGTLHELRMMYVEAKKQA